MSDRWEDDAPADVERPEAEGEPVARVAPPAATTTPAPSTPAPVPADPTRPPGEPPRRYAGYPKTKWHPVHGAKTVNDPNEEHETFDRNWFDTPAAADAARTDREAGLVVHRNMRVKLNAHENDKGVVRNSVQAQESLDRTGFEPL